MKKVVAAGIDRVLEFDTLEEADRYLDALRVKGAEYRVMWREAVGPKTRMRVIEQYNKSPLIEG